MKVLESEHAPAVLVLDDGNSFAGWSCGAAGEACGELAYDTSMIGYPEAMIEAKHAGKLLLMTYPQIGNYGVCLEDLQGQKAQIKALIVRDMCKTPSSYRSDIALDDYLREQGIVAIEGIDTRVLMQLISRGKAQRAIISTEDLSVESLLDKLNASASERGQDA